MTTRLLRHLSFFLSFYTTDKDMKEKICKNIHIVVGTKCNGHPWMRWFLDFWDEGIFLWTVTIILSWSPPSSTIISHYYLIITHIRLSFTQDGTGYSFQGILAQEYHDFLCCTESPPRGGIFIQFLGIQVSIYQPICQSIKSRSIASARLSAHGFPPTKVECGFGIVSGYLQCSTEHRLLVSQGSAHKQMLPSTLSPSFVVDN